MNYIEAPSRQLNEKGWIQDNEWTVPDKSNGPVGIFP